MSNWLSNSAIRISTLLLVWLLGAMGSVAAEDRELIKPAASLPETTPWDLQELNAAPSFKWVNQDDAIRSLLYEGELYRGKPTEVFAYYASPATLAGEVSSDKTFPAVVLVHGGGGTAFRDWAMLWAQRGYAAIAMDLAGHGGDGARLPNGGPEQGDETKFGAIDGPITDQWSYHAVANVILGHSLIRSFDEVDSTRTAITGISWGGYLTCIVAGLDSRFDAAVPVYGCGYLHDGSYWVAPRFDVMSPAQRDKWVTLWDPSMYVGSATMPMFFVNGTNDFAYWLESYAKTYNSVSAERNYRITVNMPHGHGVGWAPQEIGLFVDEHLIDGTALPRIATPSLENGKVVADIKSETTIVSSALHYTTDELPNEERTWTTVEAKVVDGRFVAAAPPTDAKIWFLTATDERDAIVSSELVFSTP